MGEPNWDKLCNTVIRIGIMGYGNLGRGAELAVAKCDDMELRCIFTRRDPSKIIPVTKGIKVCAAVEAQCFAEEIDVMLMCGGSAIDLPVQTPEFARLFNVVDSYDTHAKISEHYAKTDIAAKAGGKTAIISVGWDPGLFSLNRLMAESMLPSGSSYTFWGEGVSQGHTDAIKNIDGVSDARQYTIPVQSALEAVRKGEDPELTTRQKHRRMCYVAVKEGADYADIENKIITMPDYFADYDTTVSFVSTEELLENHSGLPHGGFVIRSGKTGCCNEHKQIAEFSINLDSNPEFTASVLVAYARAAYRLNTEGITGCKTVFDIPPAYLSQESKDELIKKYL